MPTEIEVLSTPSVSERDIDVPVPSAATTLFDARYRWVLLAALRWLRDEPSIAIDLDDSDQLSMCYELLRRVVDEQLRERGLAAMSDPMRIAAIAESRSVRATVLEVLRKEHPKRSATKSHPGWRSFVERPEIQKMIAQGARTADPTLEPEALDRRARERRTKLAQAFGLYARITRIETGPTGGLRLRMSLEEDIACSPGVLKSLEINGVAAAGAEIVEMRHNESGSPRVEFVVSATLDKTTVDTLKSFPMSVIAVTSDGVRLQGFRMV